jgi:predicted ATPase/class 3 adenylate cyclase
MPELPTGTITFLFTDIEGSTRLLQRLGSQAYGRVQDVHGRILRRAIAVGDGVEIRTEGDSFFAVFRTAEGALNAAVRAQLDLGNHSWPDGLTVRVRMGMHTGEGILGAEGTDYVGIDVNRAARIAAVGHGGQVLLSDASSVLLENALPGGVSIRDLGLHQLKDIDRPEHIHDLVIDGLPADFPVLMSRDAQQTNLPTQRTSFVGRERELREITELLAKTRLLTLTGPGGTGKTRLALKLAADQLHRFPDGICFVDLSVVSDPSLLMTEIAAALRVREQPDRAQVDTLVDYLGDRRMLLVLVNMEQLVERAHEVGDLLDATLITLVVTSRIPLHLSGEQTYEVDPLPLPRREHVDDPQRLTDCESVALFVERAAAVRGGFEVTPFNAVAVAEIVARVDGLPLALELVAGRVKVMSPQVLAKRLSERLPLLEGGPRDVPERRRTLRGAFQWSFDLLSPDEQLLFVRLAVFSGGWSLEAAERICGEGPEKDVIGPLESLVESGLVQRRETRDGEIRFRMLETIGEFAKNMLGQSDQAEVIRRRHAYFFRNAAEEAEPQLNGEHRNQWIQFFDREHDNVRTALDWSERTRDIDTGLRIASSLWRFWLQRAHLREARERLDRLIALPEASAPTAGRARALSALGGIAFWQMDYQAMRPAYEEAAEIARSVGDPRLLANALYDLSFVPNIVEGDLDRADEIMREALTYAVDSDDAFITGKLWTGLGYLQGLRGNLESAIESIQKGTAIHRSHSGSLAVSENLTAMAGMEFILKRVAEARLHLDEAVAIMIEAETPVIFAPLLTTLAFVANHDGRHRRAARLLGAFEVMRETHGGAGPPAVARAHFRDPEAVARAALGDDEYERARAEGLGMTMDEIVAFAAERTD